MTMAGGTVALCGETGGHITSRFFDRIGAGRVSRERVRFLASALPKGVDVKNGGKNG